MPAVKNTRTSGAWQVLFYCHFPDLLQAEVGTALHRAYRRPLDWAEEASTGAADTIVVNSRFTRGDLAPDWARADFVSWP